MRKPAHIVIDSKTQSFKCTACGMAIGIDFKDGIDVKELISIGKNFKLSHMKCIKKNCFNCEFMEWGEGDAGDPSGFICTKKDLYDEKESEMIKKMDRDSYREKAKRCFEPKELK